MRLTEDGPRERYYVFQSGFLVRKISMTHQRHSRADHREHPHFSHHDAAGWTAAGHGGADLMDCCGIATVEPLRSVAHAEDDGGVSLRRE